MWVLHSVHPLYRGTSIYNRPFVCHKHETLLYSFLVIFYSFSTNQLNSLQIFTLRFSSRFSLRSIWIFEYFFSFFLLLCYRSKRILCLTEVKSWLPSDLYKKSSLGHIYQLICWTFFGVLNIYLTTLCWCAAKLQSSDFSGRRTIQRAWWNIIRCSCMLYRNRLLKLAYNCWTNTCSHSINLIIFMIIVVFIIWTYLCVECEWSCAFLHSYFIMQAASQQVRLLNWNH